MKIDNIIAVLILVISTVSFSVLYPRYIKQLDENSRIGAVPLGQTNYGIMVNNMCNGVVQVNAGIQLGEQPEVDATLYLYVKLNDKNYLANVRGDLLFNGLGQLVTGALSSSTETREGGFNTTKGFQIELKGISPIEIQIKFPDNMRSFIFNKIPHKFSVPGPALAFSEGDNLTFRHPSFRSFSHENKYDLSKFGVNLVKLSNDGKNNTCPDFRKVQIEYFENDIKSLTPYDLSLLLKLASNFSNIEQ